MTEYTADDFKRAEFARSDTGWNTARRCVDPDDPMPWILDKGGARASDRHLASADWVPLDAHPDHPADPRSIEGA